MTGLLDRLNLRPAERRLVVLAAVVLFVVANLIFVWPHFGSWNLANLRLQRAEEKLRNFQREINRTNVYLAQLAEFERENPGVPTEDQSMQFQMLVQTQARQAGIMDPALPRSSTRTNDPFFIEQVQTMTVVTAEKNLVEFLYQLGAGSSLVRVRELVLNPDQQRFNLRANITLVSSYQRNPASRSPAPARPAAVAPVTAATARPATNAPAKPGMWAKVKGWFGGGEAPAATNPPSSSPTPTNAAVVPTAPTNLPPRPLPPRPTPPNPQTRPTAPSPP